MKVINMFNYNHAAIEHERSDLASEAVPDKSLTVKDILYRFENGMPLMAKLAPSFYNENDESPDIGRLDLIDRAELIEKALAEVDEVRRKNKERNRVYSENKAKRDQEEQEMRSWYQKYKEDQDGPKNGRSESEPKSTNIT